MADPSETTVEVVPGQGGASKRHEWRLRAWAAFSFGALGLLVGNLVGFTAESITASIVPLLFAFGGGSAIAFLQKLSVPDQRTAASAIFGLSLGCLVGLYAGLYVAERQLLTPPERRGLLSEEYLEVLRSEEDPEVRRMVAEALGSSQGRIAPTVTGFRYLRAQQVEAADAIDAALYARGINPESLLEAYQAMYALIKDQVP